MILDTPPTTWTSATRSKFSELVAGLGLTVFAALHDLSLASLFCDSVVLVTDGRVVTHGPPSAVITPEVVCRHIMEPTFSGGEHPETGTPHLIARRHGIPASRTDLTSPSPPPLESEGR